MRKKIISYTTQLLLILFLSSSCIYLAKEISRTAKETELTEPIATKDFVFRSVLDKKNPGTLSIKGNDNEVINVYLLEGTLYKTIAVKKGERASPGELKGDFDLTRDSGTLYANTECGIFGKLSAEDAAKITGAALPIAKKDEIKTGRATILATVSGNETREYDIEIEKIYSPSGSTRNLLLRVTDEELLAQTGGVVQGMSGSAILQDGKIIGAVTHVLLDDPSRGYGIFIENMLSAAGLSSE